MRRFIIYSIFKRLPETRCFGIKRYLLRLVGHEIAGGVRVCSSACILGAGKIHIGANTWVGHQCMLVASSNIIIGANVDIAPRVYIGTGTHLINENGVRVAGNNESMDIVIGDGSWLCASCIILPGVSIGSKSIVAAGAVVNKNVSSNCIVAGVPAKLVRNL